jgi:transcriptional regulator with XRE-family HTH domain
MRFTEIGQQLRAFRMESGLRAEEIAARLGVSRAALYRYEKGEVIKLDTVQRLAELLKISPLSLLGIGIEYYGRPAAFFERLRQIEETAEQILIVNEPLAYLTTSASYDRALADALLETVEADPERFGPRSAIDQILSLLTSRKKTYQLRKPSIIAMISALTVQRLIETGIAGTLPLSEPSRQLCRDIAITELENLAALAEAEPMGLQFGFLADLEPVGSFQILRSRERATLALNPFPADSAPNVMTGVALLTSADEAVMPHQRLAETLWRDAHKGQAAASRIRELIARYRSR